MLFFVGLQHSPRAMGHLAHGGHIGQEHKTARLLALTGHDLRALVQGDLHAIPQRFDHTGLRGARPPRAILRALLDFYCHPVIGTRQCPQLGGSGFGICVTVILLPSCFTRECLHRRG